MCLAVAVQANTVFFGDPVHPSDVHVILQISQFDLQGQRVLACSPDQCIIRFIFAPRQGIHRLNNLLREALLSQLIQRTRAVFDHIVEDRDLLQGWIAETGQDTQRVEDVGCRVFIPLPTMRLQGDCQRFFNLLMFQTLHVTGPFSGTMSAAVFKHGGLNVTPLFAEFGLKHGLLISFQGNELCRS